MLSSNHSAFSGIHHFSLETIENPNMLSHFHLSMELITVLKGELTLCVDGNYQQISEGQSAVLFSQQIHSLESINCTCKICNFSPWIPNSYFTHHRGLRPKSNVFSLPPLLYTMLLQIKKSDRYYTKKGLIYQIIDNFDIEREYLPAAIHTNQIPTKMLTFVEQNYTDNCTLERLSEALNYHPNYLSQTFHKVVGVHFKAYVTFYRLNRVCYLLEHSQLSILACAEEAGFASIRSFNRVFKNHFGLTPKEYRQKHQK